MTTSVCLTPVLLKEFDLDDAVVVVTDVMRATTCMCVAIERGAEHLLAVSEVEECRAYMEKGYLCAAERDGAKIDGFDLGNSPYGYMDMDLQGRKIAISTTNGTHAINDSRHAYKMLIGAFANLTVIVEQLKKERRPVVIVCAGWKKRVNIEDTCFAGAVVKHLLPDFIPDDSALLAMSLFQETNRNKSFYFRRSPHVQRVFGLGIQRDIKYCLKQDTHPVIPIYRDGVIVKM